MTITEKLKLKAEIDARNEERELLFMIRREIKKKAEAIHKSVEIYAEAILESLDIMSKYHGVDRDDLLDLMIDTLQAQHQVKAQEG